MRRVRRLPAAGELWPAGLVRPQQVHVAALLLAAGQWKAVATVGLLAACASTQ